MSYKRITDRDLILNLNVNEGTQDLTKYMIFAHKLWELENQIEKGELLKFPCKIGDPIWVVYDAGFEAGYKYEIHEAECLGFEIYNDGIRIITSFRCYDCYRKGNFTTKEAAEQKVKELNGEI
ncbi:MAG: hypothetical protein J1E81_06120 [Eubacterium sp.]|nr:hypothetical protein [Eubacterium sp.]